MLSFCFYGAMAILLTARMPSAARRTLIWLSAALMALAIGFSRIYLGVHYPSDVLGGYCAAAIWLASVRAGYHWWLTVRS